MERKTRYGKGFIIYVTHSFNYHPPPLTPNLSMIEYNLFSSCILVCEPQKGPVSGNFSQLYLWKYGP